MVALAAWRYVASYNSHPWSTYAHVEIQRQWALGMGEWELKDNLSRCPCYILNTSSHFLTS